MATPVRMLQSVGILLITCFVSTEGVFYDSTGTSLHRNDDGYSSAQSISINYKFFGSTYNTLYVCTNGIISFGGGISSYTPTPFPIASRPVVAPFWGDVDIRRSGAIRYKQHTSGSILSTLTSHINAVYSSVVPNFQATWAYVVTWDNVPAYPGGGSGNSFQAVLASDGTYSFVIYNYQHIGWTYGSASRGISAQVGFDAGNRRNYYAHEWSRDGRIANIDTVSNCGTTGRWMFRVDLTEIVPVEEVPTCSTGYTGRDCSQCADGYVRSGSSCFVNHCLNHNCVNGNCVNSASGFSCSCNAGWLGDRCDRNHCYGQTCSNAGSCSAGNSGYTCNCNTGYSGTNCENCATRYTRSNGACVVNYCYGQTCSGFGSCNNGNTGYTCSCNTGYSGSNCESCSTTYIRSGSVCVVNYCYGQTCSNYGSCNNHASSYSCSCHTGYAGNNCENCATAYTRRDGICVVDYCYGQTCSVHGLCINGNSDYTCNCDRGYTGWDCENCNTAYIRSGDSCVTDYCYGQDCNGHGTCNNGGNSYTCRCNTGYSGSNCFSCADNYINSDGACVYNYCVGRDCSGRGSCQNGANSYTCTCDTGYMGNDCGSCASGYVSSGSVCVINFCDGVSCSGRGTCQNGGNGYTCTCQTGYSGDNCESCATAYVRSGGECVVDYCYSVNCNQGTCLNGRSDYTCDCASGYSGNNCETRNYCVGVTCNDRGTCINGANGYICECNSPYYSLNCESTNICQQNSLNCENGGTCVTSTGACICESNFVGTRCELCHDDWIGGNCDIRNYCNGHSCLNGATCVNGDSGYACACADDYVGDYCQSYNLCEYRGIECENGGTCGRTTGLCTCGSDFTGTLCESCAPNRTGDECNLVNYCYGSTCQNGGTCVNGVSSYTCDCVRRSTLAYTGDYCETRDACFEINPDCNQGECYNLGTSGYDCTCSENWCDSDNGQCNSCCDGWTGRNCSTVDYCYQHGCQNGATCNNGDDDYTCTCTHEYTGDRCQTRDYCTTHLEEGDGAYTSCQHNGTCVNIADGWRCDCFDNHFIGDYCESCNSGWTGNCYVTDHCNNGPCQNGGTCNNWPEIDIYTCTCLYEYTGQNCETRDYCRTDLRDSGLECENNATCVNGDGSFLCQCSSDQFTGTYCGECSAGWTGDCDVIDYCYNNNCENSAVCVNRPEIDDAECLCTPEYTGDLCDIFDFCSVDNIDCSQRNSEAQCVNHASNGTCECTDQWTGEFCTECIAGMRGRNCDRIDYCYGRSCGAGTCRNDYTANSHRCECPDGYSGDLCDIRDYCRDVGVPCPSESQCRNNDDDNGFVCDFCHQSDTCGWHGVCNNLEDGYSCTCATYENGTYTGDHCETFTYCSGPVCDHGGTCIDGEDDFECICTAEWDGKQCEFINQCTDVECDDGETCTTTSNTTHICTRETPLSAAQSGSDDNEDDDDDNQGGLDAQRVAIIGGAVAGALGMTCCICLAVRKRKNKKELEEKNSLFHKQLTPENSCLGQQTSEPRSTTARDIHIEDAESKDMWA